MLSALVLAVPFLTSGADLWLGLDWIDGRKLYSIDDAYRFFVGRNAFELETAFLWNYVMPLALLFDATVATLTDGSLPAMRVSHAIVGALTLALIARASLKAGCGAPLAVASVAIVGLMPLYLILSSSFYAEGLFALLLTLTFVLLIERRTTFLAVVVGLLPMVRPEGAVYCALFLVYFAMRRDLTRCALIALPGLVYFGAVFSLLPDWRASMSWRLELRQVLAPLDLGNVRSMSFDRLLNPLWASLALGSVLIPRYRGWWPILLGPACIIAIQAIGIAGGVQDYELRYYFSTIPIFGIAWALPVRHLLDANWALPRRRRLIAACTALGLSAVVAGHSLQSDWIREFAVEPGARPLDAVARQSSSFGDKALLFDARPLRAFARRLDAFLESRESLRTVFVADHAPLYFLQFLRGDAQRELVLIPHDPAITAYSNGFFFGFDLGRLEHRYYRFAAVQDASAVLIVDDAGENRYLFEQAEARETSSAGPRDVPRSVAADIQSGSLKAFRVLPTLRDDVVWTIPLRADAQ